MEVSCKGPFKKLENLWASQNSMYTPAEESASLKSFHRVEVLPSGVDRNPPTDQLFPLIDSDATASSDNSETEGTPKLSDTPAPKR